MIEAYIENLGKYVTGDCRGDWLKFPTSQEDVKDLLSKIGVDGIIYEEIIITDYKTEVDGLYDYLTEYESLDELNYLASVLAGIDETELEKFEAAVAYGEHIGCTQELINLAQNLDCYDLYHGIEDETQLGYYLIDELSALEVPEHLENYFNYEAYGRDYSLNEGGSFVFNGYIQRSGDSFIEYYSGRDDMPDELKVFAYPDPPDKMPMKQQLEMFARMMITAPTAERLSPAREERG